MAGIGEKSKPLICKLCDTSFSWVQSYRVHTRKCTGPGTVKMGRPTDRQSPTSKKRDYPDSDEESSGTVSDNSTESDSQPKKKANTASNKSNPDSSRPTCPRCGKSYSAKRTLKAHMKKCTGPGSVSRGRPGRSKVNGTLEPASTSSASPQRPPKSTQKSISKSSPKSPQKSSAKQPLKQASKTSSKVPKTKISSIVPTSTTPTSSPKSTEKKDPLAGPPKLSAIQEALQSEVAALKELTRKQANRIASLETQLKRLRRGQWGEFSLDAD